VSGTKEVMKAIVQRKLRCYCARIHANKKTSSALRLPYIRETTPFLAYFPSARAAPRFVNEKPLELKGGARYGFSPPNHL